uniref:Integrase catalytic domain-containing protein n=1 Tax=Trichuris muris TaxID=70415 RepID=A0A5S6QJD3_TRIMR
MVQAPVLSDSPAEAGFYERQYATECNLAHAKARRVFSLFDPALGEESVYVESFFSWVPRDTEYQPPRVFYAGPVGLPNPAYLYQGDWPGLFVLRVRQRELSPLICLNHEDHYYAHSLHITARMAAKVRRVPRARSRWFPNWFRCADFEWYMNRLTHSRSLPLAGFPRDVTLAFPCADTSSVSVIKALSELFCLFGVPAYVHSDRGTAFMSRELKDFLVSKGIACSRTTAYNPQGNGQAERYVGVIWKTITLALRSRRLPVSQWRTVLPDALYALRSLLCTATNATPHERMFSFARRSTMGTSLPTWLSHPGPALLKKHVRSSKADPLVEEVELLEANPQYAYVRFPDGRESTVSLRHLAPAGSPCTEDDLDRNDQELPSEVATEEDERPAEPSSAEVRLPLEPGPAPEQEPAVPRRSTRIRRPPDRLDL